MAIDCPDPSRYLARRQAGYQRKQARATQEKGLLIVYTGPGKGKTTAAMGMALRAIGHGMQVGIVQFIKGIQHSAEHIALSRFDNVEFYALGAGLTWAVQQQEQHRAAAERAWNEAQRMVDDPRYQLIILDELNPVLHYGYLNQTQVLDAFAKRRAGLHIVVTGRNASAELVDLADLVSTIRVVKHPYHDQGIKAQPGIEF